MSAKPILGTWLHIRPQLTYHAEATIVGTSDGLEALRDAVNAALAEGAGKATVFASDGEGYNLAVQRTSTIAGLGAPTYLDEEARNLASMEREYLVRIDKASRQQEVDALQALRWCRANGNPHLDHPRIVSERKGDGHE